MPVIVLVTDYKVSSKARVSSANVTASLRISTAAVTTMPRRTIRISF